jgi:hypothetical protein
MFEVEVNNGLAFPIFEPMISGDRSVVLILLAIVSTPFVERRFIQSDPTQKLLGRRFGSAFPVVDIVDHGIANIVRNPTAV